MILTGIKNGLFITNKDLMSSYLKKYTAGTQKFYIYQLPLIKNEAYSMEIKETYPNIILENTGFNYSTEWRISNDIKRF